MVAQADSGEEGAQRHPFVRRVVEACWGGVRCGGKRGIGAPGKKPFVAAVALNREGRPVKVLPSRVGALRSGQGAGRAKCHLEFGTIVLSDALACFSVVQRAGCFRQPVVAGGGPAGAQHPALTSVSSILGGTKRSLHGSHHHVRSNTCLDTAPGSLIGSTTASRSASRFPDSPMSPCVLARSQSRAQAENHA